MRRCNALDIVQKLCRNISEVRFFCGTIEKKRERKKKVSKKWILWQMTESERQRTLNEEVVNGCFVREENTVTFDNGMFESTQVCTWENCTDYDIKWLIWRRIQQITKTRDIKKAAYPCKWTTIQYIRIKPPNLKPFELNRCHRHRRQKNKKTKSKAIFKTIANVSKATRLRIHFI